MHSRTNTPPQASFAKTGKRNVLLSSSSSYRGLFYRRALRRGSDCRHHSNNPASQTRPSQLRGQLVFYLPEVAVPVHYICALSLMHADNSASIDWGWRRTGAYKWVNKLGEEVRYLSRLQQLGGVRGCVLYLGYGWRNNRDLGHPGELQATAILADIQLIDGREFGRREHDER